MNYTDFKNKTFSENPAVRLEYDQLGPQYEAIRAAIASFENGNANPSLDFLQKMASCMGKTLHISFE